MDMAPTDRQDGDDTGSYGVRSLGNSEWYDRSGVWAEGVVPGEEAAPKEPAAEGPNTDTGDKLARDGGEGSSTHQSPDMQEGLPDDTPTMRGNAGLEALPSPAESPPMYPISATAPVPAVPSPPFPSTTHAHPATSPVVLGLGTGVRDPIPSSGESALSSLAGSISGLSRTVSPADSDLDMEMTDLDMDAELDLSSDAQLSVSHSPSGPSSPVSSASPPRGERGRLLPHSSARLRGRGQPHGATTQHARTPSRDRESETGRGRESSYVFSRTHWAVREARERMEEQGGDVSLVLPTLVLPGSSLGGSRVEGGGGAAIGAGGEDIDRQATSAPGTAGAGSFTRTTRSTGTRPLHLLLTGTNRTANAFLKALDADSRVKVYKVRPGPGPPRPRSSRRSGEGAYDVAVMRVTSEGGHAEEVGARPTELLARIHVVARGQEGNLQRAVKEIESSHQRLNVLLASHSSLFMAESDQTRADLARLVRGWARTASASAAAEDAGAPWYDLAVLTGDGRFLAGRDRDLVNHLKHVIPTLCYPDALALRLAAHVDEPFFTLSSADDASGRRASIGDPTPRCSQEGNISSYFASMHDESEVPGCAISALVEHLLNPSQASHQQREDAAVGAFLRWKEAHDDLPAFGPASASLESSATAPMPTIARVGANTDWESQLSRRYAARAERRPSARKTPSTGPLALSLQQSVQTPSGFFGEGAWRTQGDRHKRESVSLIRKAFLDPLDRLRNVISKGPASISKTGWTVAFACVAAVVGLGCWWRMQAV